MRAGLYYIIFLLLATNAAAQSSNLVMGTVESLTGEPVAHAAVYSTGGQNTITDSLGIFYLPATGAADSLYVLYNGIKSAKYGVPPNRIVNMVIITKPQDISSREEVLKDIIVVNKNHYLDSLANRKEYAKIFNAKSSGRYFVDWLTNPFNIGNLFYALQVKKNNKKQFYKNFALSLEENNYVKSRFTKPLVTTYTGLTGRERDEFMRLYEPPYDVALSMNELDMAQYITVCFKEYQTRSNK